TAEITEFIKRITHACYGHPERKSESKHVFDKVARVAPLATDHKRVLEILAQELGRNKAEDEFVPVAGPVLEVSRGVRSCDQDRCVFQFAQRIGIKSFPKFLCEIDLLQRSQRIFSRELPILSGGWYKKHCPQDSSDDRPAWRCFSFDEKHSKSHGHKKKNRRFASAIEHSCLQWN